MIEYIKGDLFTTNIVHIAHGCNCQGVMGAGVGKFVFQKERYMTKIEKILIEEKII